MSQSVVSVLMPSERRERTWKPWVAALLSLVGHVTAVWGVLALSALLSRAIPPKPKARPVTMRTINSSEWSKNRGNAAPEKPAELHPKGQVVDVATGNRKLSPDAKYLAEDNNKVDKQTRAREQASKWSVAAPKNTAKPEQMPSAQGRSGGRHVEPVSAANLAEQFTGLSGYRPTFAKLMQEASVGTGDEKLGGKGEGGLTDGAGDQPSASTTTGAAIGGAAPNDNLNDVPAGEGTYLNTREWKFAGFFNRVKQAVSAHWDPNGRLRQKDPQGSHTGVLERNTVLAVTLRPDGTISDLYVARSSGLDYLDQEAMGAFEKAQPFANPPAPLVEADGFIHFAFSFTLSSQPGGLPRMFGFGH